ncbi:MAG TPA: hypothetical protein VJC21_03825 [Candidatus Nanoarchaeia archaeon]|nr:hypothetical protein [Candidatus Nanoarchaeia archaeon]
MALDDLVLTKEISSLASQINSVPQELRNFVTRNFNGEQSLEYYKGLLRGFLSAGPVGSLGKTEQHRRPLMETAICIAYELIERDMLPE